MWFAAGACFKAQLLLQLAWHSPEVMPPQSAVTQASEQLMELGRKSLTDAENSPAINVLCITLRWLCAGCVLTEADISSLLLESLSHPILYLLSIAKSESTYLVQLRDLSQYRDIKFKRFVLLGADSALVVGLDITCTVFALCVYNGNLAFLSWAYIISPQITWTVEYPANCKPVRELCNKDSGISPPNHAT